MSYICRHISQHKKQIKTKQAKSVAQQQKQKQIISEYSKSLENIKAVLIHKSNKLSQKKLENRYYTVYQNQNRLHKK